MTSDVDLFHVKQEPLDFDDDSDEVMMESELLSGDSGNSETQDIQLEILRSNLDLQKHLRMLQVGAQNKSFNLPGSLNPTAILAALHHKNNEPIYMRMTCNLCPEEFNTKEGLAKHIKSSHTDDVLTEYLKLVIAKQSIGNMPRKSFSRKGHPSWQFFERIDRYDAMCLLCSVRVRSACSTNLTRHLTRHHPDQAAQVQEEHLSQKDPPHGLPPASRLEITRDSVSRAESTEPKEAEPTSKETADHSEMDSDTAPPHHPVAIRPAPVLSHLDLPLELSAQWCHQFPGAYQDLRPAATTVVPQTYDLHVDQSLYEMPKYDMPKYDYSNNTITYDATPKLFHDSETLIKQEEKSYDQPIQPLIVTPSMVEFQFNPQMQTTVLVDNTRKSCEPSGGKGDSGATPAKRGRPTENPCWNYFIRLDDQNVRCRICSKIVKSACATNMTKHLERHHQNDYQHLIVQIKQYRQTKGPQPILPLTPIPTGGSLTPQQTNNCLLPSANNFVKTEPYVQDIYSQQFGQQDQDTLLRNYVAFDASQNQQMWQRAATSSAAVAQWGQLENVWNQTAGTDPSTSQQMVDAAWAHASLGQVMSDGGSDKPYMKRNRKTEHPVWEFFKRTVDGNAQCSICTGIVKSPCSSNFMRHLMRHHAQEYNAVYVKWVQKRGPNK